MGRSVPLNVCRFVILKSLCKSLALSHTYCQVFLCHINSQLFLKDPVSCLVQYSEEGPAATCLIHVSEGGDVVSTPPAWCNVPLQAALFPAGHYSFSTFQE